MTNKNYRPHKYLLSLTAFATALTATQPVFAQLDELPPIAAVAPAAQHSETSVTPPVTVAMIFHKLSGKAPDYRSWAMETDAYKTASPLERDMKLEGEISNLRSMYTLTTLSEPVIIQKTVKLSPYSYKNNGFAIEDFNEDAYFPFTYTGQNYAMIIPTLPNYQWIDITEEKAAQLDRVADENGREVVATLFITPTSADATNPMTLDSKSYWLISGQIKRLVISAPGSAVPLWEKSTVAGGASGDTKPQQEILDLYRK